jgi:HD-GYP domain-containing protein (c-di-GMP phosphodiesterase class II)
MLTLGACRCRWAHMATRALPPRSPAGPARTPRPNRGGARARGVVESPPKVAETSPRVASPSSNGTTDPLPAGAPVRTGTQPDSQAIPPAQSPRRRTSRDDDASRLLRYLPLAFATTALVTIFPAFVVTTILPAHGVLGIGASLALVTALSMSVAAGEAALWKRRRRSRDIVFADLMLWGWCRRVWTERRLAKAKDLLGEARGPDSSANIEALARVGKLLETRDSYLKGHSDRVMRHAARIAQAMQLPPVEVSKIRMAAAVHDVGKLNTPREVLNNPGRLTDPEYEVMKLHAVDGAAMVEATGAHEVAELVRHHHERIDGTGYPDGLTASEIPLGARIIAVADTFDAITSTRPYRSAATQKRALEILREDAGRRLDTVAVSAFTSQYSGRRSVAWLAFAGALPQLAIAALRTTTSSFGAGVGGLASIAPALGAAGGLALAHTAPAHHAPVPRPALAARANAQASSGASAETKHTAVIHARARHGHARRGTAHRHTRVGPGAPLLHRTLVRTHEASKPKSRSSGTDSQGRDRGSTSEAPTTSPGPTETTTSTTPTPPPPPPKTLPVEVPTTVTTPGGGTVEVPVLKK